MLEVKAKARFCQTCGNVSEEEQCRICRDPRRDPTQICVVEQPVDVVSLERTHEFRGLYHVLGGALSPLDGVEPGDLRIDELLRRVDANGVEEVVLATNPNMTGEATAAFLADRLRGRVRVTRLASGLPVGGDLEYADEVTLGRALAGRREMERLDREREHSLGAVGDPEAGRRGGQLERERLEDRRRLLVPVALEDHVEPRVGEQERAGGGREGADPRRPAVRGDGGAAEADREPHVEARPGDVPVGGVVRRRQRRRQPERPRQQPDPDRRVRDDHPPAKRRRAPQLHPYTVAE
jgi:recombination protein RecR